ncbi:MAG: hypothetical protein P6D50_07765, partial [Acidimicrobiales bacterium]|nr:hypothetical protein [Acidimicrobiales bacterium]
LERTPDKGEVAGSIPASPTSMEVIRRALAAISVAAAVAGTLRLRGGAGITRRSGGWRLLSGPERR